MQRQNETRLNHIPGWPALRASVIKAQPICQLRLPGCTGKSTSVDHIVPRVDAPGLVMDRSNLRGACLHCNSLRGRQMQTAMRQARAKPTPWQVEAFFNPRGRPAQIRPR